MIDRCLMFGILVLISAVVIFSWLVVFGLLYEPMAYPGGLRPAKTLRYARADCVNYVFYLDAKPVPMSDGTMARQCGGI